jgi:hypothetical protein
MLLDIPAMLQISTHVLTGRVAGLSSKSNMDIGSTPTARYLSCCQHIADMSEIDMSARYPCRQLFVSCR